jgi:hypothetical protein
VGSAELSLLVKAKDQASSILKNVGLAAVALGAAAVVAAVGFVKAAAEEQVGMERLKRAVDLVAHESMPDIIDAWEGAIQEMEAVTAYSDGEMRDALSMLVALTGDADEAWRRLPIAMDLARGAGIDLAQASKLLGKTSDENTTALARLGIKLGENATATDVLLAVQQKFGGQSAAYAATAIGQWEILQNNIGDFAEDIGAKLLPMVTTAIGIVSEFFGVISGQAPDAGEKLTAAVGAPMAKNIMGALAMVRDTVQLIFGGDLPAALDKLTSFVGNAVPKIAAQLLKWAGEFIAWVAPMIPPLIAEMAKLLNQALGWLNEHSEEIGAALVEWGMKFVEFITDVAIPEMSKSLPSITDVLIAFAQSVPAQISDVFSGIGRGIVKAISNAITAGWNEFAGAIRGMLAQAVAAIDFWVGPFHITGSGITVTMPTIVFPNIFGGGGSAETASEGHATGGVAEYTGLHYLHAGERITPAGAASSTGGGITLVINGPVYGMQDFDAKVRASLRDAVLAGGFRGVVR